MNNGLESIEKGTVVAELVYSADIRHKGLRIITENLIIASVAAEIGMSAL
jgi:hypothetical protein